MKTTKFLKVTKAPRLERVTNLLLKPLYKRCATSILGVVSCMGLIERRRKEEYSSNVVKHIDCFTTITTDTFTCKIWADVYEDITTSGDCFFFRGKKTPFYVAEEEKTKVNYRLYTAPSKDGIGVKLNGKWYITELPTARFIMPSFENDRIIEPSFGDSVKKPSYTTKVIDFTEILRLRFCSYIDPIVTSQSESMEDMLMRYKNIVEDNFHRAVSQIPLYLIFKG